MAASERKIETPVTITAVWLRRRGGENDPLARAEVLVEIDGVWRLAITETLTGAFSHIAEGNGAYRWAVDSLTEATGGDHGRD